MEAMERTGVPKKRNRSSGQPPDAKKKRRKRKTAPGAKAALIAGLLFVSLLSGMVIGYSVIGNQPVAEVFSPSLWKHLFLLIFG